MAFLVFVTMFTTSAGAGEPRTGAEIYSANCAACHGADGKGAPKSSVGFDVPLPDFTDCVFTTPEPDADWAATIHLGGAARAFNQKMPAFVDAMSDEEIDLAIGHLRIFCKEASWPRGDLNLPRPLVTEKAFPENESVVTTVVSEGSVENQFVYERRVGRRSQHEVVVPTTFSNWTAHGTADSAIWRSQSSTRFRQPAERRDSVSAAR